MNGPPRQRAPSGHTGFWKSAAVVVAAVVATLVVLEIVIRLEEGLRLDPDLVARLPLPEPDARSPDTVRILAIGDSFTRGVWLPPESAYPALLQEDLERHGADAEVLNLGWPGSNTEDQVEIVREMLPRYEPDLVLLGFFVNDIEKSRAERLEQHQAAPENRGLGARLWALRNEWYLFRYLRPRMILVFHQLGFPVPRSMRYATQVDSEYAENGERFRRCQDALSEIRRTCDASGVQLLVLVIPAMESFEENYPFPSCHRAVSAFCDEAGIPVLDLLPAFQGMSPLKLRVSLLDNHPNEDAYRTMAEEVGRKLRAEPRLTGTAGRRPSLPDGRPPPLPPR